MRKIMFHFFIFSRIFPFLIVHFIKSFIVFSAIFHVIFVIYLKILELVIKYNYGFITSTQVEFYLQQHSLIPPSLKLKKNNKALKPGFKLGLKNFKTIIINMNRNPKVNLVCFILPKFLKFPDLMNALVWMNHSEAETFVWIALSLNV